MSDGAELVYIADPMCSWCYGFGPQFRRFHAAHPLPVRLVMGGLFVGPEALPLDDGLRHYLGQTWQRVEAMSGQPFSTAPLAWQGWTYDTELSCRAVVAMRTMAPGHELDFFTRVQQAFYHDGLDVADEAVYPGLVKGFPVHPDAFMDVLGSVANRASTQADFAQAASTGFGGFPAVLVGQGRRLPDGGRIDQVPVAVGYRTAAEMARALHVVAAPVASASCGDSACG